jgi:outer membrane protein TolC
MALAFTLAASSRAAGAQQAQPVPAQPPAQPGPAQPAQPVRPLPPIAPTSQPAGMALEEAVAFALRNNPRVGGAAARVREARARITQRRAVRYPQFGVSNFVFRQGPVVPSFEEGGNPAVPAYRWNVGVFLQQILFDWGQRSARQRVAERETDAAAARLSETQNDVRLVVTVAYYNVFRARELLRVATERRESAAEQLRVARARFDSDVAPRFDVIRAEAELANAEQEVIDAQNDVAVSEAAFNTALGRDVTTPVALRFDPKVLPEDIPFERAREAAIANRPQLEAFRQTVRATEQEIRARRAEDKPQVGLSAAYDRPNPGGFASTEYRYTAGLVMTWPFFDSGLTRGRVREARSVLEADRQALEQARQQVELDVRQAQLDIGEARRRISTAEQEVRSAAEALRVAEVRYRAGVGTNVEVTDAQVAAARAGQNLANARFDFEAAIARLESATGTPIRQLSGAAPATNP